MSSVSQTFSTKPANLNPSPDSTERGPPCSSIPLKCYAKVIPNTEKIGFNSQAKRFQYTENENPGPGLYNIIHQSMFLNNVSQSRKGTCFFPSLDVRIAHQKIPNYPASNAYDISPTLHSKKDFSLGYSSMFHPPFARKIAKKTGPAPNEYNVSVDLCKQNYKLGAKSVFSSKTKRTMSCSNRERVPSPCHYRIKDSLIRVSPPVLVSCFRSKTGRTTNPETLSPGPAAYQQAVETAIGPSKRFSGLRKCILNFSAPAVPPPQNPPLPGPGQYDLVDYRGPPKHYISSAVFVSNTKRWTGDKFHKGIPGPGTYNIPVPQKQSFMYNISNKWVPVL
ncbi:O(6)-methylguanine-induced apoptosis 2 [Ahaetulla prasina]|uniref:O(6)-methylguanine-induced apoptosis 2 n=1 Tax=Ahaetulla prasina TaxID=499056 RepID=UPI0026480A26|nr:O(6)-methylguanine-induced apoptosis 2 [Ahaetulla prasina]XP_058052158.1 O(6)-methylguanine-induced apoptosis 2 [Ahaetulla prasina]